MPKAARDAHARGEADLASLIARAFLVLNANGGSCGNPSAMQSLLKDPEFRKLAGLSEKQADDLLAVLGRFNDDSTYEMLSALRIVGPILDSLIATDRTKQLDPSDCDVIVEKIHKALSSNGGQIYLRWKSHNVLWRLHCLAKARHDEQAIRRVTTVVEALRQKPARQGAEKKSAEEILLISGESPKNSGIGNLSGVDSFKPSF
ncbi:MAG TPA: hypothetical protein PLD59_10915 [Tepidisphaeraceae bacterium]|nr:hypothetical protein [Tepidisphaeraceae bacterium]